MTLFYTNAKDEVLEFNFCYYLSSYAYKKDLFTNRLMHVVMLVISIAISLLAYLLFLWMEDEIFLLFMGLCIILFILSIVSFITIQKQVHKLIKKRLGKQIDDGYFEMGERTVTIDENALAEKTENVAMKVQLQSIYSIRILENCMVLFFSSNGGSLFRTRHFPMKRRGQTFWVILILR